MNRALLALVLLGACTKVTYVNTLVRPTGQVVEHTGDFFLAGLVGHAEINAYADCPNGIVAGVQSSFSFVDLLLTVVTFEIYAPRTYAVECGA
jgi:hypothetical protein